jgi:DNA-binding NarL/FixJ family response regulator
VTIVAQALASVIRVDLSFFIVYSFLYIISSIFTLKIFPSNRQLRIMVAASPKRGAILELHRDGHSVSDISRRLKVPRQTVHVAIRRGSIEDRKRTGRPISVGRIEEVFVQGLERDPPK